MQYAYVVYVLGDYATACGISLEKETAERYAEKLRQYQRFPERVWVERVKIHKGITEFETG